MDSTVLPVPPFGEKTVTTRPRGHAWIVRAVRTGTASGLVRLADRERDRLRQLRQDEDVVDARP